MDHSTSSHTELSLSLLAVVSLIPPSGLRTFTRAVPASSGPPGPVTQSPVTHPGAGLTQPGWPDSGNGAGGASRDFGTSGSFIERNSSDVDSPPPRFLNSDEHIL